MPTVYYPRFLLSRIDVNGVNIPMPSTTITATNITTSTGLGTLTSTADALIAEGSFTAAIGDIVEFTHASYPLKTRVTLAETKALAYLGGNGPVNYILENLATAVNSNVVYIYTQDLDNLSAPLELIGSGAVGTTVTLPYQTNVNKNVRLIPFTADADPNQKQVDFNKANYKDIAIPSTGGSGVAAATTSTLGTVEIDTVPVNPATPIAVGKNNVVFLAIQQRKYLDSYASLAAAISAIGATPTELVITSQVSLTANTVTPATMLLTLEGNGSITIDTGHTLIIGLMTPPPKRQVFSGLGTVYFAKNAVPYFDLSWWAGVTEGVNVQAAFNQISLCLAANAGGKVLIGAGIWYLDAWSIPDFTTLEGVAGASISTYGSVLKVATPASALCVVKPLNQTFHEITIRNLALDAGTSTTASCFRNDAVYGAGTGSGLHFDNVVFLGTGTSAPPQTYFVSTGGDAEVVDVNFNHCVWSFGVGGRGWYSNSINTTFNFIQPKMSGGQGSNPLHAAGVGWMTIVDPDFRGPAYTTTPSTVHRTITDASITTGTKLLSVAGASPFTMNDLGQKVYNAGKVDSWITEILTPLTATINDNATGTMTAESLTVYRWGDCTATADCVLRVSGAFANISITGGADEGFNYYLKNEASELFGGIEFTGVTAQSKLLFSETCRLRLSGGNYLSNSLTDVSGRSPVIFIDGGTWFSKATWVPGKPLAKARIWGQHNGGGRIMTQFATLEGDNYLSQKMGITTFLDRTSTESTGAGIDDPVLSVMSDDVFHYTAPYRALLRIGKANIQTGIPEQYFTFAWNPNNGHLNVSGNQVGRQYDFDAQVNATGFTGDWLGNAVPVAFGGTGAATKAAARTNLGLLAAYLTADFSKTNATLANVTDLSLTLVAGKIYQVTFNGLAVSSGTGGNIMDFNGGSATITGAPNGMSRSDDYNSGVYESRQFLLLTDGPRGGASSGVNIGFEVTFTIEVNAGGTLIPRFAQQVTNASASKLLKYATLTAREI